MPFDALELAQGFRLVSKLVCLHRASPATTGRVEVEMAGSEPASE